MPLKLDPADRKIAMIAFSVFVVVTLAAVLLTPPEGDQAKTPPTTYSASSSGAKAAYLLLKESGWNAERWEQPPSELPKEMDVTYVLAEPETFPTPEERTAIADFVRNGGRFVAAGAVAAEVLPIHASKPNIVPQFESSKQRPLAPSPLTSAPEIAMREDAYWNADSGDYVPLYGQSPDEAVAVKFAYGKGEVIWWASATPLTNGGITESGNLEFLIAALGGGKGRHVLFDEYYHGHRPGEALSSTGRALWWLLAQVAVLGIAIVLTFSRRSGPVQAPKPETRLSPLEFVETLGGLYERANAVTVPIDVAHQAFRYRLTRRLGLPANAPVNAIESSAADLLAYRNPALAATLRECERAVASKPTEQQALALVHSLQALATELKLYPSAKNKSS